MSLPNPIIQPVGYPVQTEAVPDYLLKEEIEGIKFYYKGYKDVLNKLKTKEEIMGCSSIQSFIIEYLYFVLFEAKANKNYRIFSNESGNHLAHRSNMQFDIAIYEKALLTGDKITRKYVQGIPPAMVIEIDLDVELEGTGMKSSKEFLKFRTKNLLKYGVQRVLWILTKPKKVLIAQGDSYEFLDWDNDIELLEGIHFNIAKYLAEEGVNPDAI
ncbi:MAG: Uma2 family endonuclease [Saprospiraceae bacterium]|nr:Uma2 family endonuclease [Saprospiraceae bacterium]